MKSGMYYKAKKRTKLRAPEADDFFDADGNFDAQAFQKASKIYVDKVKEYAKKNKQNWYFSFIFPFPIFLLLLRNCFFGNFSFFLPPFPFPICP